MKINFKSKGVIEKIRTADIPVSKFKDVVLKLKKRK